MYLYISKEGHVWDDLPLGKAQADFPYYYCPACHAYMVAYMGTIARCKLCDGRDLVCSEAVIAASPERIVQYAESHMGDEPIAWDEMLAYGKTSAGWAIAAVMQIAAKHRV